MRLTEVTYGSAMAIEGYGPGFFRVAGHVLRQWQVDCSPKASLRGPEYRLLLADLNVLEGVGSAELAPGYC